MMTPYEIGIMLHYHCSPDDYHDMTAPIFRGTMDRFIADGLIEPATPASPYNVTYKITAKGRYYVSEGLCKVPLPVNTWRIPNREE